MNARIALVSCFLSLAASVHAGLLVHLPFDHDARDESGAGHHAQANGDAGLDHERFQLGGGAAWFSGATNGYFNIPVFTPVIGNGPRSAAFWVCSTNTFTNNPNVIFLGWGDAGSLPGVRFDIGLQDGSLSPLRVEFNNNRFVVSRSPVLLCGDGAWHHVLVAYDGTKLAVFVDGKACGPAVTSPAKLATGASAAGVVIGTGVKEAMGVGSVTRFFAGQLDDLGIWDLPLTAADAALLNGLGRVGNNDARWLDEARTLWQKPVGAAGRIKGLTWRKVDKLPGNPGDWRQVGGPNGAGSFIVLDGAGRGLQIAPVWWDYQAVQVGGLVVVVTGGLILLLWVGDRLRMRVRLRRLEAKEVMERERRRIAQDLHDDLGSGLTEIMLLGDLAAKEQLSPEALHSRLAGITSKTRDLVAAVDEIVWTTNPVNDVLPKLADYLGDYAQRFLAAKGIACRIEVEEGMVAVPISAKVRHHLLMAIKEALNNAVKYSGASEVRLGIRCESDELRISVEDNGAGFKVAAIKPGDGLANLASRLAELGGHADIQSEPGQGTRVLFRLPLTKAET